MKRTPLVLGLIFAIASAARAEDVVITFPGLTDGETLASYMSQGFQVSDPLGFNVIGPGNTNYLGSPGLVPAKNDWFITRTDGSSWVLDRLGFSLGLVGTPGDIQFAVFGIAGGVTKYFILVDTAIEGFNPDLPQNGLPPVDGFRITMNNSIPPYQVTEIDLSIQVVPEPASLVLGSISAALLGAAVVVRKRRAPLIATGLAQRA